MDLLPYTDFDCDKFLSDFRKLNADAPVFQVSCRTGQGIEEWAHWLEHVAEGEIHIGPHTHPPSPEGLRRTGHADLDAVIQPHQHPHRQHHTEVKRG
jgi:hypothetical protein